MELKELTEKTMKIFECSSVGEIGSALMECVKTENLKKMEAFQELVQDLSVDWLQMIFQYYQADRKEKMQDYTPRTLSDFVGRLVGVSDTIIDMCAGSGALTIQKWNRNHDLVFQLYELDENVIPFLLFNMAIRNISCIVYHSDVLQQEVFHTYKITRGEKYGILKEIKNEHGTYF